MMRHLRQASGKLAGTYCRYWPVYVKSYLLYILVYVGALDDSTFRYDQLMNLGWKILIPLALFNMLVTGAVYCYFRNK